MIVKFDLTKYKLKYSYSMWFRNITNIMKCAMGKLFRGKYDNKYNCVGMLKIINYTLK